MKSSKNNSKPKKHHYLSKMYLEYFCQNGSFWVFDRIKNEYRKQTPLRTTVIKGFYSIEEDSGNKNINVENFLSEIEGFTKPILEKINNLEEISFDEKSLLSLFIAIQKFRVPYFKKVVNEFNEKMTKTILKDLYSSEEVVKNLLKKQEERTGKTIKISAKKLIDFVQSDRYCIETHRNESIFMMLTLCEKFSNFFRQMDWIFLISPDDSSFLTSDNPFIFISSPLENNLISRENKYFIPGARKLIPMSNSICLLMLDKGTNIKYKQIHRNSVQKINLIITENCDRFVICRDKKLLEYLVKKTNLINQTKKEKVKLITLKDFKNKLMFFKVKIH